MYLTEKDGVQTGGEKNGKMRREEEAARERGCHGFRWVESEEFSDQEQIQSTSLDLRATWNHSWMHTETRDALPPNLRYIGMTEAILIYCYVKLGRPTELLGVGNSASGFCHFSRLGRQHISWSFGYVLRLSLAATPKSLLAQNRRQAPCRHGGDGNAV